MKHAVRAALTVAVGVGLAAAAQAEGTYGKSGASTGNTAPTATMPSDGPNTTMPGTPSTKRPRVAAPAPMREDAAAQHRLSRAEVKQAQQRLKSEGLYRGPIDGIVGPGTRQAIARFQERNRLNRTARLDQNTLSHLMGGPAMGSGSRAPSAGVGSTAPPPTVLKGSPASPNGAPAVSTPNGAGGSSAPSDRNLSR